MALPVRRSVAGLAAGLLFVGFTGAAMAQRAEPMTRQVVVVPERPNAVCNDGTPPVYYFHPGSGDGANKWVIYFQGGGGCSTDAACRRRAEIDRGLTTSDDLPATIIPQGILSTVPRVNPDFAAYNHVFLHYCSSDGYAGDGARTIDGDVWQFRGREIVAALLDDLSSRSIDGAPTMAAASEVFVTGSSAGAMGVHNNLDRIAARFPAAKVRGLADSVWLPPGLPPYGPGSFDVRPDEPAAMAFTNAQPDESCAAANSTNPGVCLDEAFVFPYVETPMFLYADQRDPALLGVLGVSNPPSSEGELAYVEAYAAAVRESLVDVPAYFAPSTGRHTVLMTPRLTTTLIGERSFADVLHDWYFDEPGELRVVEQPQ